MRATALAITVLGALFPAIAAAGCSAAEAPSPHPRRLLSYREEGGVGGPRPALVVSTRRRATLRLGRCATSFELHARVWRKLRAGLSAADLASIAGDYPPPPGAADEITYVVRSAGEEVRIAPAPAADHEAVMAQLEPLLRAIEPIVASGERRPPDSCAGGGTSRASRGDPVR